MFQGRYAKYLLPGVLFQSTLIGGGYASGREIVEFGGRFGADGIWSILVIFTGFSVLSALTFEFARVAKAYDYHSFIRGLIGPLWWLFDVLFVVMAVLVIAIVAAATGAVAEDAIGIPSALTIVAVIALVAGLLLGGGHVIERFKTMGTGLLYVAFGVFGVLVLARFWPEIGRGLAQGSEEGAGAAMLSGAQYVSYNLVVLPAVLFALYRQDSRKETFTSGAIAGALGMVPFVLTFLCLMAFYPDPEVFEAGVPWLVMLGQAGGSALVGAYAIVVVWTLVETATGLIHAIMGRVDVGLAAVQRPSLSPAARAVTTVLLLGAALLLAQVGIVALVAQGYGTMAYFFFALYALPLLTIGVYKIVRAPSSPSSSSSLTSPGSPVEAGTSSESVLVGSDEGQPSDSSERT
jgi:uncharacterized membrane protein YkvI